MKETKSSPSTESIKWLQMAHDLQSPITALKVIAARLEKLGAEDRELIESAIVRVSEIVGDILKPDEKVTQGNMWTPASLFPVLRQKQIEFPNVELGLNISIRGPVHSSFPAAVLNRVISNLLNNACEANGMMGQVFIRIRSAGMNGCSIEIEDQGPGLPDEIRNSLGRLGVSGKDSSKRVRGIGLYSVFSSVHRYGGRIEMLDKSSDRGTTFRLSI